jgi:gas vesicle protein
MGSFTNGVLVGVGISLLLAPRPGKETRRMLAEGLRGLGSTPKSGQPSRQARGEHLPTTQEVVEHATQQDLTVPEYSQQVVEREASGPSAQKPPAQQGPAPVPPRQGPAPVPPRQGPASVPPRQGGKGVTKPPRSTRPSS